MQNSLMNRHNGINSKDLIKKMKKLNLLIKALFTSIKMRNKYSLFIIILGIPMAFIPALMALVLKNITNNIQILVHNASFMYQSINSLLIFVGLFFLQTIYNFFKNYSQSVDSQIKMIRYIKKQILQYKCEVKYKYIENFDNFNDRISFVETLAGKQVAESLNNIIDIVQNTIKFISITYVLCRVNVWIVVALLISSIPALIISRKQKDELYYARTKWIRENALALHYYYICSNEGNLSEIRHLGILDYLRKKWRYYCDIYINKKKKLTVKHIKYNLISDGIINIVYIFILSFSAYLVFLNKQLGLGTFVLIVSLSKQMQDITAQLFNIILQFITNLDYMSDFFSLENMEQDANNSNVCFENGDICFKNVSFKYPNTNKYIFSNLNITIKQGEKIAIVGENGSGKTTFINLLCGMYEPIKGKITINNQTIKNNESAFRRCLSVVFQDFGKYNDTLKNNITISDMERNASEKEILQLIDKIEAKDIINSQKNGMDEQIGAFSADSNELSGGQWQKVAILRAAYRSKASIMILDEPTSALDPRAETCVYKDFTDLTAGKTTVLVSHRLGITSLVDRILVFKNGRIVEDGTISELLENQGEFYRMYKSQAELYKG